MKKQLRKKAIDIKKDNFLKLNDENTFGILKSNILDKKDLKCRFRVDLLKKLINCLDENNIVGIYISKKGVPLAHSNKICIVGE